MSGTKIVDACQPFKVRASCGHIVIRKMREATAGVPYTPETVLEAPNGRACEECERTGLDLIPPVHLTLSGRDGEVIRSVFADGVQIGVVRQSRDNDSLWIADDMQGHCHGVTYLTDWYAAKQLALGLGMRAR